MKAYIFSIITLFAVTFSMAQIDRTKQPKSGPAPKIALEVPGEFQLKNGMKVMVVENHKLPRVSYQLRFDNLPALEGDKAGVANLLGSMLGNGTATMPKDTFVEEVDYLGAQLNFGSSGGFASGLSKYSNRILQLMADATINPLFTEEEFKKEKEKLIQGLKTQEKSVSDVASRVGGVLAYGAHHPYGEYVTEQTINNITLDNLRSFYQKRFNPSKAYLVIVGDVNFDQIKAEVQTYFGKWEKGIDVETTLPKPIENAQYTQINFVDMPNAVQSEISLMSTVDLKMSDPDYHAVLIANKILGGGFNSYLNMNLREANGYTYGARSNLRPDRHIARFSAGAAVRNMVTDSAIVETVKEIKRIRTENVSEKDLANAKAKYVGDFVLALESPQTVARYALNTKLNNLPSDFYTTFLTKINAVTVDDVKRVANTYFNVDKARIVVVGKGADVIENLEKTKIPVKYFDKYGNPTEKPSYEVNIPDGVTVKSVLEHYLNAIGGLDKVKAVKGLLTKYEGSVMGSKVVQEEKRIADKYTQTTYMNGSPMMSVVANDKEVYMKQAGQKIPMPAEMLTDLKASMGIFPELTYLTSGIGKLSKAQLNGKDAYTIEIPGNTVSVKNYYDVETGLKLKEESTVKVMGQTQKQESEFSDYEAVDGILLPKTKSGSMGPQKATFKLLEAKINPTFSGTDFE